MAYSTGTTESDSYPAKTFMESIIHPLMTANGWTYVEEYVSSGRTARIYKSPATGNGVADFYVTVYRSSDSGTAVAFGVGEVYDTGTHRLMKYAPYSSNTVPNSSDYTIVDASGKDPTLGESSSFYNPSVNLSTTGHSWWLSVNVKRLIVATRVASTDYQVYVGLVDNLIDTSLYPSAAVPILIYQGDSAGSSSSGADRNGAAMTREPGQTAATSANWAVYHTGISFSYYETTWPGGMYHDYDPLWTGGKHLVYRVPIRAARDGLKLPRALFPADVVILPRLSSVHGDTITLDGKTWVQMMPRMFVDTTV